MINVKMKLEGFEGLNKKLQTLPIKLHKRVLQAAVTGALREVRKDIKARAPQGPDKTGIQRVHRTAQAAADWARIKSYGTLKNNITLKKLRRVSRGQKGARIDTGRAFWALFYEFGTRSQPARPFFAPAFRAGKEKVLNNLSARLRAGIEKIAQEK